MQTVLGKTQRKIQAGSNLWRKKVIVKEFPEEIGCANVRRSLPPRVRVIEEGSDFFWTLISQINK